MFSKLLKVMAVRAQAQEMRARQQQRVTLALVRQAQAATGVRQLALVDSLARLWLPARLLPLVVQTLQAQLVVLQTRTPGSPKSTGCSARTARRSTSRRRRRR